MRDHRPFRRWAPALAVAVLLAAGCTAGDSGDEEADEASGGGDATTPVPSGPAPGVTDTTVTIGITYVDLASLGDVVDLDHGDYVATYQALIDDINEGGGIHGRTIEAEIVGINPVGTDSAEAACVELTEDVDVFAVMGFFLDDAATCIAGTHATAVLGGTQTDDLLAQAEAPWYTAAPSGDNDVDAVRAMVEAGELDGTVGVFAFEGDADAMTNDVLPLLDELGVEVADSAINDAPADDTAAANARTAVIAERFEAEGVDQVLLVANAGLVWATGVQDLDYRPDLRMTTTNSILAYAGDPANDTSMLEGSVGGNLYGGPDNLYALPTMQECIGVLEEAGVEVPDPATVGPQEPELYVAPFSACRDVALLRGLLEAAGEDLNYGTLAAGADGLEIDIPVQPEPATFGPPPSADGDLTAYLYDWDADAGEFVIREP